MNETIKTKGTRTRGRPYATRTLRLTALALLLFLTGLSCPSSSWAAGPLSLPAGQTINVTAGNPGDGMLTYALAPAGGAPALPGSGAFGYEFTLTGLSASASVSLPADDLPPGFYAYTLRCLTQSTGGYTTDARTYGVEITVNGNPDSPFIIIKNEEGVKVDSAVFAHTYSYTGGGNGGGGDTGGGGDPGGGTTDPGEPTVPGETTDPEEPEAPGTPNIPTPSRPGGSVSLLDNGNYVEFDENGVPLGEWVYDPETDTWIFEEYPPMAALPQTGLLKWPIPVMTILGALLFIAGLLLNRGRTRKEERDGLLAPGLWSEKV